MSKFHLKNVDYIKQDMYIDWTKRIFKADILKHNWKEYIKLYIKFGKKYPADYINAFFNLNVPFWYPDYIYVPKEHSYNPFLATLNLDSTKFALPELQKNKREPFFIFFESHNYSHPLFQRNFITGMLFSTGLPIWILFFCIFIAYYQKQFKNLLLLLIPMTLFIMYLFSPTYLLRYSYSLIVMIPLIISTISIQSNQNRLK
jgi:hypothetical protein